MEKIRVHDESTQERWNSVEHGLKNAAEKVCGWSKGGKKHGGGMNRLRKLLRGKRGVYEMEERQEQREFGGI